MAESIWVSYGMDNVLGLENPEAYRCIVWQFHVSHSWLRIELDRERTRIYADFAMVSHFEGAMRWQGARMKTASEEECLAYLRQSGNNIIDIETIKTYACLYLLDTPHSQIKIIAAPRVFLSTQQREYLQIVEDKLLERITTDIETGEPCIISTTWHHGLKQEFQPKTLLSVILEQLEEGYTQSEILSLYPWLEPKDIQAALVYARRAISKPSDTHKP